MKNSHPLHLGLPVVPVVAVFVMLAGQVIGEETGDGGKKGRTLAEEKRTQSATFAVG